MVVCRKGHAQQAMYGYRKSSCLVKETKCLYPKLESVSVYINSENCTSRTCDLPSHDPLDRDLPES